MPDRVSYWRGEIAEYGGHDLASDVVDELASHLAEVESSSMADGASADEAHARTLAVLHRASFLELASRPRAMHRPLPGRETGVFRDLRMAVRHLRRSPGFTATALLTLAVGVGANSAIFTLVRAVLLKSLPVTHAERLYKLGDEYRCCPVETVQGNWSVFPYPFYLEVRGHVDAFEEIAAADTLRHDLSVRRAAGPGAAESFAGEFVSGNYFSTLGVAAAAGRLFDRADDRGGAAPVVVASYAAWQRWGGDKSVIGAPLTLNGVTVTLAGVTPPGFFGDRLDARPPDFWLPMALEPAFTREESLVESPVASWVYVIGRLHRDAAPAAVQTQLTSALRDYLRVPGHVLRDEDRKNIDAQVIRLVPGGGGINAIRRDYEQGLWLLFAVSASVLLIACANLANLLLVRGAQTRTATAVEIAMGASRFQIVRRHLTETLLLSLTGGALGLLTAIGASRAIVALTFRGFARVPIDTSPSTAVLSFTFVVSLATGLVFGVGPAWIAGRSDPSEALRGSGRVVGDGGWSQRVLIVLQAAMSLVLVTVAALLSQSLRAIDRQSYGFDVDGRLVVEIDPQSAGYTPATIDTLYRRLDDRLSRVPGVISASESLYAPQQRDQAWGARVFLEGGRESISVLWNRVGPRYFSTIGTPVVRGRVFTDHDRGDTRRVAIVNETFASRVFPNSDPIGRHFGKYSASHANDYEIVGIVKDARYTEASNAVRPMFFVPLTQAVTYEKDLQNTIEGSSRYVTSIELFAHGDPDAIEPAVRAALADVDPNLAPKSATSFRELIGIATSQRALTARLSDAFGLIALLLAAIGLYGVTAYRVARRRNEIGLRMALGASRSDIAALVMRGACSLTAIGLMIGIPLALLTAQALRDQLFGVSPFNVPILLISVALVVACALLAAALPARRAAAIAPMEALRET